MKRISDTNILIRYLMQDDKYYYEKSKDYISKNTFVPLLVLSEMVYVLKGIYKINRVELVNALIELGKEVTYENNDIAIKTLENFKDYNLDFVDCYLLARNKMLNEDVISFDKGLNKVLNSKSEDEL